jgi:DNA-directed RNA polymerase specialized sigma24 family protein
MKRTQTSREFDTALGKTKRAARAKEKGLDTLACAREGFTIDEIMYVTGCTYGTAKSRKSLAKEEGCDVPNQNLDRPNPVRDRVRAMIREKRSNMDIAKETGLSSKTVGAQRAILRKEDATVPRSPRRCRPERATVMELLSVGGKTQQEIADATGTYVWYVASVWQDMRAKEE